MRYYKTWQEALKDFLERFGHNYESSYSLMEEFEQNLGRNDKGVWFMYWR